MLLVLLLLTTTCVLQSNSAVLSSSQRQHMNLFIYGGRIETVYQLLLAECPDEVRPKREVLENLAGVHLEVQKQHYNDLLQKLLECRKRNTLKQTTTAREEAGETTTVDVPTTTVVPDECISATNLSESWRADTVGSDIGPGGPHSSGGGYNCDMHGDLKWFRFVPPAGTRMLNKCPRDLSCGADDPYWTDEIAPREVGVKANITVYDSMSSDGVTGCRNYPRQVQVMRCSLNSDHDLIYKHIGTYWDNCDEGFCGMM